MAVLIAFFWLCLGMLIGGLGMMWLLLWPDARREQEELEGLDSWDRPEGLRRREDEDFRA